MLLLHAYIREIKKNYKKNYKNYKFPIIFGGILINIKVYKYNFFLRYFPL